MARFVLPFDEDDDQRRLDNLRALVGAVNELAQWLSWGDGAPAHTPRGRQVYVRLNGGTGSTLYYWNGSAWVALP